MSNIEAQKLRILSMFKTQFITFLDEMIAQFPNEPDLVIVRIFVKDQVPVEHVLLHIIKEFLPFKEKIEEQDDSFFLNNKNLFAELSPERVVHFKRLWASDNLDKEDKAAVWAWFSCFITLAERYQQALGKTKILRTAAGGYIYS